MDSYMNDEQLYERCFSSYEHFYFLIETSIAFKILFIYIYIFFFYHKY